MNKQLINHFYERIMQQQRRAGKSTPHTARGKVGRNEKCPCGSGKKYKHCHGRK